MPHWQALHVTLALVAMWLVLGVAGLAFPRNLVWVGRVLFPLGALVGLALGCVALCTLDSSAAQQVVLPIGLPDLPMHLRLDALSAFFMLLISATVVGVSLYAAGYFRAGEGTAPGLLCLQYHVFLASMTMVVLADDAYAFMVAWETMALSSYFLVTTQHRVPEIRRAGFLYLLLAHLGAIALLLCFGVMQGGSWQFTFEAMRQAQLAPAWASVAFGLALVGFGAKAGLVPLHVWLPEAHPAAPSPVSALMSAVMLKTAVYGLIRISFDLLHASHWQWGAIALGVGAFTGTFGAIFAAVQTDMKRLLAYSSIENIGLIVTGIGLALMFYALGRQGLAALALGAALYHALNHSQFKSLLFLVTGSVLHATGHRNLGKLGGLIRRMPWVAAVGLFGTLAMAGLPPLNGFVSEWLLLQAYLFTPTMAQGAIGLLAPLGAAVFALTVALAAYVLVKFYGVIFLGRAREIELRQAHDAGWLERAGLIWLSLTCTGLGLFPVVVLRLLDRVSTTLVGTGLGDRAASWWAITPTAAERATYSPLAFGAGIALTVLITYLVVRSVYRRQVKRGDAWDCGFPAQTARMQDTAEGFGQPIRRIFGATFFRIRRHLPTPFDEAPRYALDLDDRWWDFIYRPVAMGVQTCARWFAVLQHGNIALYLLYSFLTLAALLALVL